MKRQPQGIDNFSYLANDTTPSFRQSSAYHESGHATVAVLLGIAVDAVELPPEGSNIGGRFRFGIVRPDQADAVVVVCKAGLLAELVFNPATPRTPRRQDEMIARRATHGRLDLLFPAPRQEYFRAAELAALRLVGAHLPVIAALAQQLLENGKLTGAEVTDFVRNHLSLCGATPAAETEAA